MNQIPIKALLIGTAMCLVISIVMPFGMLVMGTVQWSGDFISADAILLIFVAVVLNTPLQLLKSRWALTPQELVIIYTMALVGSAISTVGLTAQLIPFLGEIFYFATPENDWQSLLQPYIKPWLVPLAAWGSFALALYLMMIAIVALVHKQWSQHERLIYPLIQLPVEMLREADGSDSSRINPFLRNPFMWLGFALPIILLGIGALHKYATVFPEVSLVTRIPLLPGVPDLFVALRFIVVGLTYFLSLEISFSLWFFYLFYQLQLAVFTVIGYSIPEHRLMHTEGSIAAAQQAMGAMIALVLIGLWTARDHLKSTFRAAFARQAAADDEGGLLSNRTAVWLLLAASFYAVTFLSRAGLPLAVAICLLFIAFVVFFGLTRIVAEGGMGYGRAMMTPTAFTTMAFGTSLIGPEGHMVLAFSNGWAGDIKICLMAAVANGTRLAERFGVRGVTLFWAMILAIAVSLVASAWLVMTIAYNFGGINLHYWFFHYMGDWSYRNAALVMATPVEDWNFLGPRGAFTALGAAVMLGLTWLRHTLL